MQERTAGLDLASEEHRLAVVESNGRHLQERRVAHSEDGIGALVRHLRVLRVARVAIEQPNGLVVDRLLDAGIAVVAVHPNQLAAARDRYRSGGGKSDGFDAYVLAELARTDMHRLRLLEPDSDETKALRTLTRTREDLVEQKVALANQLRAQLDGFWPGAKQIFADVDPPIALAFLERYPSPADARGLGTKRLAGFLARNGYSGRRSAEQLLERLRAAPAGRAGEAELEARRAVVLALIAALKPLVEQIRLLTSQIAGAVRAHDDGHIFLSLFRDPKSVVTAAELLAETGDNRHRHPSSASLEAMAGQAPVAVQSGKKRSPASAGPATRTSAPPSASSPTAAATTTPGPPTSTNGPAHAATTTHTPSASSAAPGSASSGSSGKTKPPTTPTATAASTTSPPPRVDTGRLMPARAWGCRARSARESSTRRARRAR